MRNLIGVMMVIILLVGCQQENTTISDPAAVLEPFISAIVDVNYEEWKAKSVEFEARINKMKAEGKLDEWDPKKMSDLYEEFAPYCSNEALEMMINSSLGTEYRILSLELQADS